MVALLSAAAVATSAQTTGVLRVIVTVSDAAGSPVPLVKHALLISDNPPTREPRRIVTGADGTVIVSLTPGSYIVESDQPVAFQDRAYQWTMMVDVGTAKVTVLDLNVQNAEVLPLAAIRPGSREAGPPSARSVDVAKWQASLVTVWSPTRKATGFVVDARGLIATDGTVIGSATAVEVQSSSTVKVPGQVLTAGPTQGVAIVWADPRVLGDVTPLPLTCPPAAAPALEEGDEIVTTAASLEGPGMVIDGAITGFHPRGIETDMRLGWDEAGGPVVGPHDKVVGLTSMRAEAAGRRGDVVVVRAGIICEALAAARTQTSAIAPPEPQRLPVEPTRSSPAAAASPPATATIKTPPVVSSSDFDVAFITPSTLLRAREKVDWTGGKSVRAAEVEARLGRLTDFGDWSEYFAEVPPVLTLRITPKLVESFWMRIAREAARTQGAALPAFKDFKANFLRLRAACGDNDVLPIHPFVIEHAISDDRVLREGLYVFSPDAFGPHCRNVTLTLSSEQAPDKRITIPVDAKIIEQIWQDLAPYRKAG
jgi:hypothetical protein